MTDQEDEIILSELDDEELVQQMFDDLYDGLKEEIEEAVHILLERKWEPYRVLTEALVGGMTIVGQDFRDGILFVPEVLLAANAMKGGMSILKPSIVPDEGGKDVFVHISAVERSGLKGLADDQPIEYELYHDERRNKTSAVDLKLL